MSSGKRILIFDEDPVLISILSEQLKLYGEFLIVCTGSLEEAVKQANNIFFDLILLDTGLSDTGGQRACHLLRGNCITSPIIVLTQTYIDKESIFGFEACADDYITKPFRLGMLLKCMRTHFRQQEQGYNTKFDIGPYTFEPSNKLLVNKEDYKEIYLTDKETAILEYLYKATEGVTSRDILLDEVWGYNESVTTHTLETHVYRLRQKIETDPSNSKILITETGGYRLAI